MFSFRMNGQEFSRPTKVSEGKVDNLLKKYIYFDVNFFVCLFIERILSITKEAKFWPSQQRPLFLSSQRSHVWLFFHNVIPKSIFLFTLIFSILQTKQFKIYTMLLVRWVDFTKSASVHLGTCKLKICSGCPE